MLFDKLHPKLTLTEDSKPKHIEDRVARLEDQLRDLRVTVKKLVEILEKTLEKDLDQDGTVGSVSPRRGLPKTARLKVPGRKVRSMDMQYP